METLFYLVNLVFIADPLKVISLEPVDSSVGPPLYSAVWLAADGTFLAHNQNEVFHWRRDGSLRNRISRSPGLERFRLIIAVHYEPKRDVYWLVDGELLRSLFFKGNGDFLGFGYENDARGHPRDVYFRQLIGTTSNLFALDWGIIDLWQSPNARLLRQISFEIEEEGRVLVRRLGFPFHELTLDQARLSQNFKLHFIVEDMHSGNLFVAFQLSPYLRQYLPAKGQTGGWTLKRRAIPLDLPGFREPPRVFDEEIHSFEEYLRWFFAWSRINGLYPMANELLLGYEIPDPHDSHSHLQALARFEMDGMPIGSPTMVKGDLMGVHQGLVFLFREERKADDFHHQVWVYRLPEKGGR